MASHKQEGPLSISSGRVNGTIHVVHLRYELPLAARQGSSQMIQ
jgi:hypothetical protein